MLRKPVPPTLLSSASRSPPSLSLYSLVEPTAVRMRARDSRKCAARRDREPRRAEKMKTGNGAARRAEDGASERETHVHAPARPRTHFVGTPLILFQRRLLRLHTYTRVSQSHSRSLTQHSHCVSHPTSHSRPLARTATPHDIHGHTPAARGASRWLALPLYWRMSGATGPDQPLNQPPARSQTT